MLSRRQACATLISAGIVAGGLGKAHGQTRGEFQGRSNHVTTGGVTVQKLDDGRTLIRLGADFSLDGAPDPVVGLGHQGRYDARTQAGPLRSLTGAQDYILPANVRSEAYGEVYIWCEQFSVPLGVAQVN
ncbi:MAG: DM13 domain-containing protein [Pseudomonadota bacterium]